MNLIRRLRLSERVTRLSPRLVVLQAPAGFGKTSLAREIAQTFERHESVDCALADDAASLARTVTTAIAALAGRGEDVARTQLSTIADDAEATALAERLWRELDVPGAIVFENAETLLSADDKLAFVQRLMRASLESRVVIVCTRVRIPGIAGRRGPHDIVTFREHDLRFSEPEVAELLEPVRLAPEQLHRLHAVSGGWAIALRLFEHVALDRDIDTAIDELERLDTDTLQTYVTEDVLPALNADAYDALLACAAVPELSRIDIDAYFGERAAAVAAALSDPSRTPFVTATANGTFEPHPLIRSAVRARASDAVARLLLGTAAAHRALGNGVRAAQLYMHAGDQSAAAEALGPVKGYLLGSISAEVGALLSAFEKRTLLEFPGLWQAAINYRVFRIEPDEWFEEARYLWANLKDSDSASTWCGVGLNLGSCLHNRGRHEELRDLFDELATRFPADPVATFSVLLGRRWLEVGIGVTRDLSAVLDELSPLLEDPAVRTYVEYDIVPRFERFVNGNLDADQRTLVHAIELARSLDALPVLVLVLIEAAFAAWFAGDDEMFERYCDEVRGLADSSVEGGVRHFLDSIDGLGTKARFGGEKLNGRSYVQLIAASRAGSRAEARRLAEAALASADESRQPAYRCLARIALAVLDHTNGSQRLAETRALAAGVYLPALARAIEAFAAGSSELGILTTFVARFRALSERPAHIEVRLLEGRIERSGVELALPDRGRALLFTLASEARAFPAAELADRLWPESDGDRAINALRVTVNRVRRVLGPEAIQSTARSYSLGPNIRVDLRELEALVRRNVPPARLSDTDRERLVAALAASAPDRLQYAAETYRAPALLRHIEDLRQRALHALGQQPESVG